MEQILECVPEVSSEPLDILTRGYVPAQIMYTAVQFDVFSHFTEPGLGEEVVGKLGLSPVLGAKFFNALVAIGLLEKTAEDISIPRWLRLIWFPTSHITRDIL